jgi:integrase
VVSPIELPLTWHFLDCLQPFRIVAPTNEQMSRAKRRKKDRFAPRKTRVNGELYWQVNLLPKIETRDGQQIRVRQRKTFRKLQEAETCAEQARIQAKNYGAAAFSISDRLRMEAVQAERTLKPFGASIMEAVKFYAEHLCRVTQSESVANVVKEILAAKEHDNLRPRYLSELRARLNRFAETFGERKIASLSAGEIDGWLRGFAWKPSTRNTVRLCLSTLFGYAEQRGWCQENPIAKVRKIRASGSLIGILTPEQLAKLLESAREQTLPYWLLGGFAGLRRAEIERLEWKDIHFDLVKYKQFAAALATGNEEAISKAEKEWRGSALVEVPALKSKTASRRFVQIEPNLAAWLESYIGRTGMVCPRNLRKLLEVDRRAAGLKTWPSNALRHSFASYHLAHFRDAAKLALELGHTSQDLIFRHYRELVKPNEAAKYWSIQPATQTTLVALSA